MSEKEFVEDFDLEDLDEPLFDFFEPVQKPVRNIEDGAELLKFETKEDITALEKEIRKFVRDYHLPWQNPKFKDAVMQSESARKNPAIVTITAIMLQGTKELDIDEAIRSFEYTVKLYEKISQSNCTYLAPGSGDYIVPLDALVALMQSIIKIADQNILNSEVLEKIAEAMLSKSDEDFAATQRMLVKYIGNELPVLNDYNRFHLDVQKQDLFDELLDIINKSNYDDIETIQAISIDMNQRNVLGHPLMTREQLLAIPNKRVARMQAKITGETLTMH